jgi:hypothetical protein
MNDQKTTDQQFPLSFNSYAAFDATTLKGLMQQRLVDGGVFTDQIFEGSNFNSLLDVIAYSYHVLLFYLNRTASEASFSTAQLYENVNRIVKILNYNPIGIQTSVLSFSAIASDVLPEGIYTIPRYSYFNVNDINYSFAEDTTFTKTTTDIEVLNNLNDSSVLYQGSFVEYPLYVATGEDFEEFNIVSVDSEGNNDLIDHNNIHVYVKPDGDSWREYRPVNSLYLENPISEAYEIRLNENQRYVLKFGNNITGKKLNRGDFVAVYYLRSDGPNGEVGPSALDGSRMFLYNSQLYSEIMNQVRPNGINILNLEESIQLSMTNSVPSSKFNYQEDSKSIKENAKNTYKTQYRLINSNDFENFIKKNFSNLVQDVKVVNNNSYVSEHLNYFNDLGLSQPNLDSRILFNQVNFANSCNFNNIYVYCIPRIPQSEKTAFNNYLNIGLKTKIKDTLDPLKVITSEVVFQDPVYVSVGLGVSTSEEISRNLLYPEIISETRLIVKKTGQTFISDNLIRENIINLFSDYFRDQKLGKTIDLDYLNASIYGIDGVESFACERNINDQKIKIDGLSFLVYNPIYSNPEEDIQIITQSLTLPYFKASYYDDFELLSRNIVIE